jgi:threonine aldolase
MTEPSNEEMVEELTDELSDDVIDTPGGNPAGPAQDAEQAEPTDDELRAQCTRFLMNRGRPTPAEMLDEIASLGAELTGDVYGEGGAVTALESQVTELLGKPAAVFMPSGTMAQQIALRVHADRIGRRVIAFHPTCHLELYEDKAYQRLHGLIGRSVGDAHDLMTRDDLAAIKEPLAAVVFELPQRELGGLLPSWDDLRAQTSAVRETGAAVHLDGARLWECTPYYGRDLHEIAALFDSVYVSFYKGLGGLAGSCLVGDELLVGEAREWRKRHGGTLYTLWPNAASGLVGLRDRLPRMQQYVDHARAIATALHGVDGVQVRPDPPQTPMMHLHLRTDSDSYRAAARRLVTEQKLWVGLRSSPAELPGWRRIELTVGDATLDFAADEVRDIVASLIEPASAASPVTP